MTFAAFPAPQPDVKRSRWTWVGTAGGALLGVVLLFGAFGKVLDPVAFAELLSMDGLDFLIPANVLVYVALALEIGVGLALLLGIRHSVVLVPAVFIVALFLFITGRHYMDSLSGAEVPHGCGCFGNLVERSPAEAFWQDIALLVPSLGLAFVGRGGSATPLPLDRLGAVAGATLAALTFTFFAMELPIDDYATRLQRGLAVADMCAGRDDGQICLETVVPELVEGKHLVIIADITDRSIYGPLNAYTTAGEGPFLWVLSPLSQTRVDQVLDDMLWEQGIEPLFAVVHAPAAVIRPLYRSLPRAFLVEAGRITATWAGMPPILETHDTEETTDR